MTDDTTTPLPPAIPPTDPTPVKPGWQTTEWYLSLAAMLLTALYASGVIPTGGLPATIAAIAATVLTALGYKVSRTLIKTASAAALLVLLAIGAAASLTSCAASEKIVVDEGHQIVDCARLDADKIAVVAGQLAAAVAAYLVTGRAVDWDAIEASAEAAGLAIGGCALGPVIAQHEAAESSSSPRTAGARPPANDASAAWAAFARLKARAGVATYRTSAGDL